MRTDDYLPMPGVIVGDMGAKVGLHGLDNGYVFTRYIFQIIMVYGSFCSILEGWHFALEVNLLRNLLAPWLSCEPINLLPVSLFLCLWILLPVL